MGGGRDDRGRSAHLEETILVNPIGLIRTDLAGRENSNGGTSHAVTGAASSHLESRRPLRLAATMPAAPAEPGRGDPEDLARAVPVLDPVSDTRRTGAATASIIGPDDPDIQAAMKAWKAKAKRQSFERTSSSSTRTGSRAVVRASRFASATSSSKPGRRSERVSRDSSAGSRARRSAGDRRGLTRFLVNHRARDRDERGHYDTPGRIISGWSRGLTARTSGA